jgi:erythronate-4-phosphate dehydrogenase
MKTVVAETVMLGGPAFETLGRTVVVPDRDIAARHLADADALIIRSKTRITADLIEHSPVRFIGTATAGFEHIDCSCLEQRGIAWTAAPGCNADSVADYMTAALLRLPVSPEGRTIGIIGAGQVGSRVARRAEALGMRVLLNDPPRAEREGPDGFQTLESVLAASDLITLHVPLTADGAWPTKNMADDAFFGQMKPGSVFINTARGAVMDSDALLRARAAGILSACVLDVWNPEPHIRADVLAAADLGTPHIAGHSLEGKLNGTLQVYKAACRFFDREPVWNPEPELPPVELTELEIDPGSEPETDLLSHAVSAVYDIMADQLTEEDIPGFDRLRADYRVRREFKKTHIKLIGRQDALKERFRRAGFSA